MTPDQLQSWYEEFKQVQKDTNNESAWDDYYWHGASDLLTFFQTKLSQKQEG